MFDPDPARTILRLGADKPRSAADEMADIERQMEVLCARHAELALDIGTKVAQSEPISVSGHAFTDNDFWTNRHRSEGLASGPHPLVFRTPDHVHRLNAAARGEIGDPAEDLRQERLTMALNGFDHLDAPL